MRYKDLGFEFQGMKSEPNRWFRVNYGFLAQLLVLAFTGVKLLNLGMITSQVNAGGIEKLDLMFLAVVLFWVTYWSNHID